MSHENCPTCTHFDIAYCPSCQIVYCRSCKMEFVKKYTFAQTTIGGGGIGQGGTSPFYNYTNAPLDTCDHN